MNTLPTMGQKVMAILGSVRFYIITLSAIVAILSGQPALTVIEVWLAAVAGIGTLDSVASKIGGVSPETPQAYTMNNTYKPSRMM